MSSLSSSSASSASSPSSPLSPLSTTSPTFLISPSSRPSGSELRPAPVLTVVMPCYNEEEVLPSTSVTMLALLEKWASAGLIDPESRLCLVNDGSTDRTWSIIQDLALARGRGEAAQSGADPTAGCAPASGVWGIQFTRNYGHQAAILAGMMTAKPYSDCVVTIDADLQDDPEKIADMVEAYRKGAEIVYGVRQARTTDTAFKRSTAEAYYKIMNRLGAQLIYNHADFRLMSQRALEGLEYFHEAHLFLRGLVPRLGLPSAQVTYDRTARTAGESKYTLPKMLALAWHGLLGFSTAIPKFLTGTGIFLAGLSFLAGLVMALAPLFGGHPGALAWLTVSIWFLGGLILSALGYLALFQVEIFQQTLQRPPYLIADIIGREPHRLGEGREPGGTQAPGGKQMPGRGHAPGGTRDQEKP